MGNAVSSYELGLVIFEIRYHSSISLNMMYKLKLTFENRNIWPNNTTIRMAD